LEQNFSLSTERRTCVRRREKTEKTSKKYNSNEENRRFSTSEKNKFQIAKCLFLKIKYIKILFACGYAQRRRPHRKSKFEKV